MRPLSQSLVSIAVALLGLLASPVVAESRESQPSGALYDKGDGWAVMRDARNRMCLGIMVFDENSIALASVVYGGKMTYTLSFMDRARRPQSMTYDYEIRNERTFKISIMGRGYPQSGDSGYVLIGPLGLRELNAIMGSRTLYVETNGIGEGHYDLDTRRRALGRFSDCLNEDRKKSQPPTPSKPRRMN